MEAEPPIVIKETDKKALPRLIASLIESETPEEMKAYWEESVDRMNDETRLTRDIRAEAMERLGVRPDTWLERDISTGLYPDIADPEFAGRLYRKTEFATLQSDAPPEDTCERSSLEFETTPVQRLGARFLHPSTPYRGLLLNHGVGVGKTCSAITVAETYLETMPHKTVYILAPQAIAEGFKRTIFDASKLLPANKTEFKLTGERWKSPQCTGMTYPRLTGTVASESRDEIQTEAEKLIRRRYSIMGYLAFANMVKKTLAQRIPDTIRDPVVRKDREKTELMAMFSDHLIIIDEAHNLRDIEADSLTDEPNPKKLTDAAEGKQLTPVLWEILRVAEGLRLMLMTATPMYNTAPEIVYLLKLLKFNDSKDESELSELTVRSIFQADGTLTESGQRILATEFRRYVSYMRGENPNTFPLRLTPPSSADAEFLASYPEVSISRRFGNAGLSEKDKQIMGALPLIVHTLDTKVGVGKKMYEALEYRALPREEKDAADSDLTDAMLDENIQMGNITYPNGMFGTNGWRRYFKESTTVIKGTKVKQYTWQSVKQEDGSTPSLEDVFGSGLATYAPKIAAIVKSITSAKGISFVYSRYVNAGALPLAVALELVGMCRVLADGTPAPILSRGAPKPKQFYVLLTSDVEQSPNFKGLFQYATTFASDAEAEYGTKIKAILGSAVASEGLDLKCIRELHLLDGWYHLNRIEQIIGRGVRFCSHIRLPKIERNCLIYLHAVNVPKYETADLYAYRLASRKAQPIGAVTRLMKENAWDCMLNKNAIMLKDIELTIKDAQGRPLKDYTITDAPYSSACDFMTCGYMCTVKPSADAAPNISTYKEYDFRAQFLKKQSLLAERFETETALPLEDVKRIYAGMPWSMASVGLREALGRIRIKREDGIYGTLILKNGYVVFQPDRVTSTNIPLALRYGRAFGRLPRTFIPLRGSVLQTSVPAIATVPTEANAAAPVAGQVPAAESSKLIITAKTSLGLWRDLLNSIITQETGKLDPPTGFGKEAFNGWRWLFNHFGTLAESISIGSRWWMDNVWSNGERAAVLSDWVTHGVKPDEKVYADSYRPGELFHGELSGYLVYDSDAKKLLKYCYIDGDTEPSICSEELESVKTALYSAIGKDIDRKNDTGSIFGMLVSKKGNVIFKSVEKSTGAMEGAECANNSNLREHRRRIKMIQDNIRAYAPADSHIRALLLADGLEDDIPDAEHDAVQEALKKRYDPKAKGARSDVKVSHVKHLSLKQICPYMEFLLRWMDIHRLDGKRWFLSVVDAARAGARMA
jgi:superfamily II DNA or RNA helicase